MKKLILGTALAALLATPALAQSYSKTYGTGNTVNLPRAEKSNGASGVGIANYAPSAQQSGANAFAFAPPERTMHSRRPMRR